MSYSFFAAISRMKYINRWALMRNAREENLSEHSMDVAVIAHALCTIGNLRFGKELNADRAAVIGMLHDTTEIITGDMPTPVKYLNSEIRDAYRDVERSAEDRLLSRLPDDLEAVYEELYRGSEEQKDRYLRQLVKAADKISALIKCMDEEASGNADFRVASASTKKAVDELCETYPEVKCFCEEFLPAYGKTLDELL